MYNSLSIDKGQIDNSYYNKQNIQMNQNGVTDMTTAKAIARKLYATYTVGGQVERSAM